MSVIPAVIVGDEGAESLVARSFTETFFTLLNDDLLVIKKDLPQDIKAICKDPTEIEDRVSALEVKETPKEEEVEHLRQEVLRLQE
ncbi:hypothetical protein NDU88_006282 [Pleurodeles waltl]|uniref:Uncharacterized protein n=1 Tax=Pleurodeles waltl TaxID=8319 RepID=A0AAV7RRF8_PLEWA|nr:hypothetical protein NDU88_006282 [Pleurodeles waltl]